MTHVSEFLGQFKDKTPHKISALIGWKKATILLDYINPRTFDVKFEDKGSSTLITSSDDHKSIVVIDKDFLSVFCSELGELILRETPLQEFTFISDENRKIVGCSLHKMEMREGDEPIVRMNLNEVYEWLVNFLNDRNKKLQTSKIRFDIYETSHVLSVLPLCDGNKLENIEIHLRHKDKSSIDFQEIIKLDNWNSAISVCVYDCFIPQSIPLQHFYKFPRVCIRRREVSGDELRDWVKVCLNNATFRCFTIFFEKKTEKLNNEESEYLIGKIKPFIGYAPRIFENSIGRFQIVYSLTILTIVRLREQACDPEQVFRHMEKVYLTAPVESKYDDFPKPDSNLALHVFQNHLLMERILKTAGFIVIQTLRKVSRGVRQMVDHLKPDPKIAAMKVELLRFEAIDVAIFSNEERSKRMSYWSDEIFQKPTFEEIKESLKNVYENLKTHGKCCVNEDILIGKKLDQFAADLAVNLRNQISVIQELRLDSSRMPQFMTNFYTREYNNYMAEIETRIKKEPNIWNLSTSIYFQLIENVLKSLDRLLPVKKLSMQTESGEDVLKVVRNLVPFELDVIEIRKPDISTTFPGLDISEISTLGHWKNAKELLYEPTIATYEMEFFSHFSVIDVHLFTILLRDVVYLKNIFQNSSEFDNCKINFDVGDIDENIFEEQGLGLPHLRSLATGKPSVWFFQSSNPGHVLHIRYYEHKSIAFACIARSKAPENAVIRF